MLVRDSSWAGLVHGPFSLWGDGAFGWPFLLEVSLNVIIYRFSFSLKLFGVSGEDLSNFLPEGNRVGVAIGSGFMRSATSFAVALTTAEVVSTTAKEVADCSV